MKLHRNLARTATLALATIALVVGLTSGAADAGTTGVEGRVGSYSVAPVTCRHKIKGQFQSLSIYAPPPRVVAANRYAGSGNDAQWVRYVVLLRDYRTLQTVAVSNWSGWTAANDNYVSTWSSGTSWSVDAMPNRVYRVDYLIEWYSGNTKVGTVAHHANNVHYYSYSNVLATGLTACFRYI